MEDRPIIQQPSELEPAQPASLTKKERRQMRRQEREQQLMSAGRSRRTGKVIRIILALVVVVGVVGGVIYWLKNRDTTLPGEAVPEQPALHIQEGEPIPGIYHTNPPVSGWHYGKPAEWGIYDQELSDQQLIHNLEHGGIWISYKPSTTPPEVVENLKKVAGQFRSKVILTPREANNDMIALAAWGRLDKFDYFDEERIVKFIKALKNKGPEFVPD